MFSFIITLQRDSLYPLPLYLYLYIFYHLPTKNLFIDDAWRRAQLKQKEARKKNKKKHARNNRAPSNARQPVHIYRVLSVDFRNDKHSSFHVQPPAAEIVDSSSSNCNNAWINLLQIDRCTCSASSLSGILDGFSWRRGQGNWAINIMQHFFPLQIRSIHACITYIVTMLFRAPSQLLRLVVCMRLYICYHACVAVVLIN
jgi:hypothetical protein